MRVRDDIGQLLWVGFAGTSLPSRLAADLDAGRYGATILFKRNLAFTGPEERCDLAALLELTRDLHRHAPDGSPALIAIDHEGGAVQRIRAPATRWPPMMAHDRWRVPEDVVIAEQVGAAMGDELRALGIDINFSPVLDVHTNPANPIIGDRAFGTNADTVARRALAFARGLDAAGVLGCGKHFPGHGDTDTDSHLELPRVAHSWERLNAVELAPFRAAASTALPMIMTAHVVFTALDATRPATLSERVVSNLLRAQFGYRGVIVSDDLDMRAISAHVGVDRAAVAAIRAGCDVLLLCENVDHQALAAEALERACETDAELRGRVLESSARVRAMKAAHLANQVRRPQPPVGRIGCADHQRLADRLSGAAR